MVPLLNATDLNTVFVNCKSERGAQSATSVWPFPALARASRALAATTYCSRISLIRVHFVTSYDNYPHLVVWLQEELTPCRLHHSSDTNSQVRRAKRALPWIKQTCRSMRKGCATKQTLHHRWGPDTSQCSLLVCQASILRLRAYLAMVTLAKPTSLTSAFALVILSVIRLVLVSFQVRNLYACSLRPPLTIEKTPDPHTFIKRTTSIKCIKIRLSQSAKRIGGLIDLGEIIVALSSLSIDAPY